MRLIQVERRIKIHIQLNSSLRLFKYTFVLSLVGFLCTCGPLQKEDTCLSANVPRTVEDIFSSLECIIHQDPGHRGINKLWTHNTLLPAVKALSSCQRVIITTGFYIIKAQAVETDGPLGAIAIARALKSHGKEVLIITDSYGEEVMQAAVRQAKLDVPIEIVSVRERNVDFFLHKIQIEKDCSTCFIAIERVGRASNGRYYNMMGGDISDNTAPIDEIFIEAMNNHPNILTIGIGDGGNEIGMGNIIEGVIKYIPRGKTIASIVKSDFLITTGVSNWGGYAVAFGLYSLHNRSFEFLPRWEEEYKLLKTIVDAGAVDGSGAPKLAVDGLNFDIHKKVLISMLAAVGIEELD